MQLKTDDGRPPAPFEFLVREPTGPLRRSVESIWYARGTVPYTRERIAPTGSTVAVFVLGDPIRQIPGNGGGTVLDSERGFLLGPHDRPTINEPLGETFAVGIITTPVGCEAIFGIAPRSIRGQAVDLETIWPPAIELGRGLRKETVTEGTVSEGMAAEAMLTLVEERLTVLHDPAVSGLARCDRAVEMLEQDPARPIADIARELGISHGHLDREFTRVVGLTPRSLAGLLRMRRLLQRIDITAPVDWSEHAAALDWFDQAHLIRDFKRHTGVTPSQYLEAQRAAYTTVAPGDGAGFVPEP